MSQPQQPRARGRSPEPWAHIEPEQIPRILLDLKLWQLDAVPELADHDRRIEANEAAFDDLKLKLEQYAAAVKAGVWIVGLLWAVSVTLLGLWLGFKGH